MKRSRIKEPSTWAGIAAMLGSAAQLPIPGAQPWLIGLAGITGGVAMLLREGGEEAAQSVETPETEQ